jgi:putative thioredoxin
MKIDTTDANFEKDVIEKSKEIPVLVEFWAAWCGPCQMIAPILENIANDKEYENKFVLVKLNTEENQVEPQKYGVMSLPTIKLFKNGEIVDGFLGAIPEDQIKEFLDKNLK